VCVGGFVRGCGCLVCMFVCMFVWMCVWVCLSFLNLFIIILHVPLLCSNTICIVGFLHNYVISTKFLCSIYKFVKLTVIV